MKLGYFLLGLGGKVEGVSSCGEPLGQARCPALAATLPSQNLRHPCSWGCSVPRPAFLFPSADGDGGGGSPGRVWESVEEVVASASLCDTCRPAHSREVAWKSQGSLAFRGLSLSS